MVEPKKEFAKILSELEREIKDPKDLEIAKSKLFEVGMLFMDVTTKALESNTQYDILSRRIDKMQKSLKKIEEDIYIEDDEDDENNIGDQMHDNDINTTDEDFEFEIKCPYCNYEFIIGHEEDLKDEIECPKCHKEIELDWDDYCDGECSHCGSICYAEGLENTKKGENSLEYLLNEDDEQYYTNNNQSNKENNKKKKDSSSNRTNQKSIEEENFKNQKNNENEDDM